MSEATPLTFREVYPAPWRIEGDDVLDADGDEVVCFDDEDAGEVAFWQGIIDAVNAQDLARRARVIQAARAL